MIAIAKQVRCGASRHYGNKGYYIALSCVVTLALVVRLHQLGADDLWIDEAFTGFLALTHDWLSYLGADNTPPLYYLLERAWCSAVSCSPIGLRLPSVFAAAAFIVLAAMFCRRLFGTMPALIVAGIVAVSPLHVYYSQEARVYSILLAGLMLFLWAQWEVIHGNRSWVIWLFLACLCALYLHFLALIVVGVCFGVFAVEGIAGVRKVPPEYFVTVLLSFSLFVPWLVLNLEPSSGLAWTAQQFFGKPIWQFPLRTIITFLTGPALIPGEINLFLKRYVDTEFSALVPLIGFVLLFLFFGLLIAALRLLPKKDKICLGESVAFLFLTLLAMIALSFLVPVYVVGRYDIIALPAFLLCVGGVAYFAVHYCKWPYQVMFGAAFLMLIGAQIYKIIELKTTKPYQVQVEYDTRMIASRIRDGDGLLVATPEAIQVWYHLHAMGFDRQGSKCVGNGKRFTCRLFPQTLEATPAAQDLFGQADGDENIDYFTDLLDSRSRVFLYLRRVSLSGGNIQVGPVGGGIANHLIQAGYTNHAAVADGDFLIFSTERIAQHR